MEDMNKVRLIERVDYPKILEIYRPFVEHSNITFEYQCPSLESWSERIDETLENFPWIVVEIGDEIAGYAYAYKHRERVAYSWSCEVSVYLQAKFQKKGLAKILYAKLMEILKFQGFINVYAIVTTPNLASEKFHQDFGFYDVGLFYKSGYKLGHWHNTRWFQLHLDFHHNPPKAIIPFREIKELEKVKRIMGGDN